MFISRALLISGVFFICGNGPLSFITYVAKLKSYIVVFFNVFKSWVYLALNTVWVRVRARAQIYKLTNVYQYILLKTHQ